MDVQFINNVAADCSFSIQWNGGQTERTPNLSGGQSWTITVEPSQIPDDASCWATAYVQGGPNHQSSGNFNYTPDGATVTYTLTGPMFDPSFSCDGCS